MLVLGLGLGFWGKGGRERGEGGGGKGKGRGRGREGRGGKGKRRSLTHTHTHSHTHFLNSVSALSSIRMDTKVNDTFSSCFAFTLPFLSISLTSALRSVVRVAYLCATRP